MSARRNQHKGSLPPCMFQPCPHGANLKTPKKEANLSLEKIIYQRQKLGKIKKKPKKRAQFQLPNRARANETAEQITQKTQARKGLLDILESLSIYLLQSFLTGLQFYIVFEIKQLSNLKLIQVGLDRISKGMCLFVCMHFRWQARKCFGKLASNTLKFHYMF